MNYNVPYKEVALNIESTVELLDMPEENISTLLCYLENHEKRWIKLENPVYSDCKIQCYGGANQLKLISTKCPPLAAAAAIAREKGDNLDKSATISFPVVSVLISDGLE